MMPELQRRSRFVLVADDDRDTRELYRACFDTSGYRTAEAETGACPMDHSSVDRRTASERRPLALGERHHEGRSAARPGRRSRARPAG